MSLGQKTREADRVYEEFEPPLDWDHDDTSDTLILMIPGFKKEQLRVQVTTTRVLRVSGERQINENKSRRFRKEYTLPPHSDTSNIGAKFESGILYIKLPKLINNNNNKQHNNVPTQESPKPQQQTIPQKPNTSQVSDQKKQVQQESKKDEENSQKKPKDKGKAEELKDNDDVNKNVESKVEKRSLTMEMVSKQRQEYVNAVCSLVDEVKKQKKLINVLLLVFNALLFGLYVKNVFKSFFSGGHKNQEL